MTTFGRPTEKSSWEQLEWPLLAQQSIQGQDTMGAISQSEARQEGGESRPVSSGGDITAEPSPKFDLVDEEAGGQRTPLLSDYSENGGRDHSSRSSGGGTAHGLRLSDIVALISGKPGRLEHSGSGATWTAPNWFPRHLGRDDSHPSRVLYAVLVAVSCSFVVCAYFLLLENSLKVVWKDIPALLFPKAELSESSWHQRSYMLSVVLSGGLLVGLCIKHFPYPGDLPYMVHCVHNTCYIPLKHIAPMLVISLVSIVTGGSLGPEAPIVLMCGSVAGAIGRQLGHRRHLLRSITLSGMACGFASFFGVPLGGSIFALEVVHRMGMEFYEDAIYAIMSGSLCCMLYHLFLGLPLGGLWTFPVQYLRPSAYDLFLGIPLGLIGAMLAWFFLQIHKLLGMLIDMLRLKRDAVLLGVSCALLLGALALIFPETLFWGELEIGTIVTKGSKPLAHIFPRGHLWQYSLEKPLPNALLSLAKMAAISITLHGGFRGGIIFPLFFVGASAGVALQEWVPSLNLVVATMGIACATNVAITRTAVATALILASLSGEDKVLQPCLIAGLVSLVVTNSSHFQLIKPQRPRQVIQPPQPDGESDGDDIEEYNPLDGE